MAATPAVAAETGGVAAVAPTPAASGGATPTAPATPVKPVHTDPVTAPTPNIAYTGPVYEKTVTGQVVPYVPPRQRARSTAPPAACPSAPRPIRSRSCSCRARLPATWTGWRRPRCRCPRPIQEIIWAGNELIGLPYIYGGGHASFISPGYDCSGTVSFALHGANLLQTPEDSSEFEAWGSHGVGRWVTIFANPGHAYMTVAGLRLDTSSADDPSNEQGPRWRPLRQGNEGFVVRHPLGL